jgi:hypothetical protein
MKKVNTRSRNEKMQGAILLTFIFAAIALVMILTRGM